MKGVEKMIRYVQGDLFESGADALVNAVNTVGIMGKGLAWQFKNKFPLSFEDYKQACSAGRLSPGGLHIAKLGDEPIIINFATKSDWKLPSKIEYIENGCIELKKYLTRHPNVKSVAMPALGCGNGGLVWGDVRKVIEKHLMNIPTQILVYEPSTESKTKSIAEPSLGIEALILLKMSNKLKAPTVKNLKMAVELLNKENIIIAPERFESICDGISKYKMYHGYSNAQTEYNLYRQICSKNVDDKLKSIQDRIETACKTVNNMTP